LPPPLLLLRPRVGLQLTGATLIWCSTTPVPAGRLEPPRRSGDVPADNAIATLIMNEEGVEIHGLHGFVRPRFEQLQIPVNVHFSEAGSAALADKVAARIAGVLDGGK
jgi:acyl-CoA thioesterase-1